jgi:hypothetical protein
MQFAIDIYGTRELRGVLQQIRQAGDDPRPAFEEVADFFEKEAAEVFRTHGRSAGGWKPLSALYAKYRYPRPRGVQTGGLLFSMVVKGDRNHRRQITRDQVTVKSRARHAHLFHKGRGGQPARPLVRVTARTRREVAGILQRHLTGGRRR